MVRTSKVEPGSATPTAKSRVVVPGHNDQDLGDFRSDSPTAPQLSLYFLLVIAAAQGWLLRSFDVETAFLNGEKLLRELYCWPPADIKGVDPRNLWKLKKGVFGLTEAPRLWWLRIRKDLLKCGWTEVKAAPATFILLDAAERLCGILVLHVDDGLVAGEGAHYEKSLEHAEAGPSKGDPRPGHQVHRPLGEAG